MKKLIALIACMLALVLCLTGCGQLAPTLEQTSPMARGGTLVLRVNPEIAVEYDDSGRVTGVTARNNDALSIVSSCSELIGKSTREAVTQLVNAIGEAGYFVEELEGEHRQIVLEIEAGSVLPHDTFLEDVAEDVRSCVRDNDWYAALMMEGESDFGLSDYIDTDYGPGSDGVTDYTDYDDTDYGPGSDGVTDYTDYDDTDYGAGNDSVTDYTDYDDTDYGNGNTGNGNTDYSHYGGDSDYSNYGGNSDYSDYEGQS